MTLLETVKNGPNRRTSPVAELAEVAAMQVLAFRLLTAATAFLPTLATAAFGSRPALIVQP